MYINVIIMCMMIKKINTMKKIIKNKMLLINLI